MSRIGSTATRPPNVRCSGVPATATVSRSELSSDVSATTITRVIDGVAGGAASVGKDVAVATAATNKAMALRIALILQKWGAQTLRF
jgi:hypothetical protein